MKPDRSRWVPGHRGGDSPLEGTGWLSVVPYDFSKHARAVLGTAVVLVVRRRDPTLLGPDPPSEPGGNPGEGRWAALLREGGEPKTLAVAIHRLQRLQAEVETPMARRVEGGARSPSRRSGEVAKRRVT